MSYQKVADLIMKLRNKTTHGEVKWEATSTEGIYQTILAGYAIRISKTNEGEIGIILQIYNEDGELIEQVNDRELLNLLGYKSFEIMFELFETARRIAMGTEQAVNKILDVLGEDDVPF
jgi:hypothetical protein